MALALSFAPQCGDATSYLELGQACAAGWARCWDPLRPMGAVLFYSLPYRLGLPPESIIVVNWLLVLGSVALLARTTRSELTESPWARWSRLAAILAVHGLFCWGPSWNSLSDLPAAVFALAGVQFLLLSRQTDRWWCHLATGLCLGVGVSLRAFYLYPTLLTVAAFLLSSLHRPRRLLRRCAVLAVLLPIALQVGETYRHSTQLGFLYPPVEKLGKRMHFQSTLAGYDTSMAGVVPYEAKDCFRHSRNFQDALDKKDVSALACVLVRRYRFYFDSYTAGGKVYLASPTERHRSAALLVANTLALAVALALLARRSRRPESLVAGGFLLMVLAQALVIVPEARFLLVVSLWMWGDVLAAGIACLASGRLGGYWKAWRARASGA